MGRQKRREFVMGSLRAILLSGAVVFGASGYAYSADLLPPAPRIEAPIAADPDQDFSGWYIRGDMGIGLHRSAKMKGTPDPLSLVFPNFVPVSYNIRPAAISGSPFIGAGFGYKFNNWFRADITAEYRTSTFSSQDEYVYGNPLAVPANTSVLRNFYRGNLGSMVYLLNAYVDLGTWHGVTPFIGAGIGISRNTLHGVTDEGYSNTFAGAGAGNTSNTSGTFKTKTTTQFAWALMAGAAYDVNSRLKLEMGYRYLNMGGAKAPIPNCNAFGPGLQPCAVTFQMARSGVHDVRFGFRWMLDEPGVRTQRVYPASPDPVVRKY
jgi:opacity protein-like surface antigen